QDVADPVDVARPGPESLQRVGDEAVRAAAKGRAVLVRRIGPVSPSQAGLVRPVDTPAVDEQRIADRFALEQFGQAVAVTRAGHAEDSMRVITSASSGTTPCPRGSTRTGLRSIPSIRSA